MSTHVRSASYTMVCAHVRGGNPRALASGLSPVIVDKYGIAYISLGLAHKEIFQKVGKGGIYMYVWT